MEGITIEDIRTILGLFSGKDKLTLNEERLKRKFEKLHDELANLITQEIEKLENDKRNSNRSVN